MIPLTPNMLVFSKSNKGNIYFNFYLEFIFHMTFTNTGQKGKRETNFNSVFSSNAGKYGPEKNPFFGYLSGSVNMII